MKNTKFINRLFAVVCFFFYYTAYSSFPTTYVQGGLAFKSTFSDSDNKIELEQSLISGVGYTVPHSNFYQSSLFFEYFTADSSENFISLNYKGKFIVNVISNIDLIGSFHIGEAISLGVFDPIDTIANKDIKTTTSQDNKIIREEQLVPMKTGIGLNLAGNIGLSFFPKNWVSFFITYGIRKQIMKHKFRKYNLYEEEGFVIVDYPYSILSQELLFGISTIFI
jgi:hypothetical protein